MKAASTTDKRCGSALLAVLAVAFVVPLAVSAVIAVAGQEAYSARRTADMRRAKLIAEAGANKAYSMLSTNFALRTNQAAFVTTSFAGGTYAPSVRPVSSNQAVICSTGIYRGVVARTVMDVRNWPDMDGDEFGSPTGAYSCVILAGGKIDWRGNVTTDFGGGLTHANGLYYVNGSQCLSNLLISTCVSLDSVGGTLLVGDAQAPLYLRKSPDNVTGTALVTNVPLVAIPDIDLTPYYNWAVANTQVFSSRSLSGTVAPPGGVMWVNGNLSLGNGEYTGCFIATGDIEVKTTGNGEIRQHKVNQYPAFVTRDGQFHLKQAKTFEFNGLIYCKTGNFDKQANGDINAHGAIICAGDFLKVGGWTAMFYENSTPIPPGVAPTVAITDQVVVEAWQE